MDVGSSYLNEDSWSASQFPSFYDTKPSQSPDLAVPRELLLHTIRDRSLGGRRLSRPDYAIGQYMSRQLPSLLREKEFNMQQINKIFAARWISNRQVVFGTKCNKLMVLDVFTHQTAQIPSLVSSADTYTSDCPCGIHSIAVNPSNTMIATGGANVNDLAVYRLPTFDPHCVGEKGHRDWIFDMKWLDDEFLVTGSRDSHLALWLVKNDEDSRYNPLEGTESCERNLQSSSITEESLTSCESEVSDACNDSYRHIHPQTVKFCQSGDKIRAFALNRDKQEMVALSLNGYVHLWDISTFRQRKSTRLRYIKENVCIAMSNSRGVYAVGSQSEITLVDSQLMREELIIPSPHRRSGVRSVSFHNDVLVIGTGAGSIYFYDLRAAKFLPIGNENQHCLNVGRGYLRQDETFDMFFSDLQRYPNAVYVHCFDQSGTRLFTGGGPLPAGLWGNYAALWQ